MFDQLPESSTGGHLSAPKVVAGSVCGILLGFGLCGIDSYLHQGGDYGNTLAWLGAALFVISVLVLIVTLFVLIVKAIISFFTKK